MHPVTATQPSGGTLIGTNHTMLTMERIFQDVALLPTSLHAGVSARDVREVWAAVSDQCRAAMLRHTTIVIPSMCHLLVSTRTAALRPHFLFLPTFCTTYNITTPQEHLSRITHNATPAPNRTLNPSVIALKTGVRRDAVRSVLNDIVRRIGEVARYERAAAGAGGVAVELDGVVRVELHRGGRYTLVWHEDVLASLSSASTATTGGKKLNPVHPLPFVNVAIRPASTAPRAATFVHSRSLSAQPLGPHHQRQQGAQTSAGHLMQLRGTSASAGVPCREQEHEQEQEQVEEMVVDDSSHLRPGALTERRPVTSARTGGEQSFYPPPTTETSGSIPLAHHRRRHRTAHDFGSRRVVPQLREITQPYADGGCGKADTEVTSEGEGGGRTAPAANGGEQKQKQKKKSVFIAAPAASASASASAPVVSESLLVPLCTQPADAGSFEGKVRHENNPIIPTHRAPQDRNTRFVEEKDQQHQQAVYHHHHGDTASNTAYVGNQGSDTDVAELEREREQVDPSSLDYGAPYAALAGQEKGGVVPPMMNAYLRHKAHKARARRSRTHTCRKAWDVQQQQKAIAQQHERDVALRDQQLAAAALQRMEEETRQQQCEMRMRNWKVNTLNAELRLIRTRLPRGHSMGSIFVPSAAVTSRDMCTAAASASSGYAPSPSAGGSATPCTSTPCVHTGSKCAKACTAHTLQWQVEERTRREQMRREENLLKEKTLIQMDQALAKEERERRDAMRRALREDWSRSRNSARAGSLSLSTGIGSEREWGGDLFFENLSAREQQAKDALEQRRVQCEASQTQAENLRVAQARVQAYEQACASKRGVQRQRVVQELLRAERERAETQRVALRASREALCKAWEHQMHETAEAARTQAARRNAAKIVSLWKNESSEEEEEANDAWSKQGQHDAASGPILHIHPPGRAPPQHRRCLAPVPPPHGGSGLTI